jgi:hypothetical protein
MPDVIDVIRDTDPVPRNRWSETAEGRAARERAFDAPIAVARPRRRALSALVAVAVVLTIVGSVVLATRGSEPTGTASAKDFVHGTWSALAAGPATDVRRKTGARSSILRPARRARCRSRRSPSARRSGRGRSCWGSALTVPSSSSTDPRAEPSVLIVRLLEGGAVDYSGGSTPGGFARPHLARQT